MGQIERATLRAYGYTDAQIDAMSPAQRQAEYQNATAAQAASGIPDGAIPADMFLPPAADSPAESAGQLPPEMLADPPSPEQIRVDMAIPTASPSEQHQKPKTNRGRAALLLCCALIAVWFGYQYLTRPSIVPDQEPTMPACRGGIWDSAADLSSPLPEVKSTLRRSLREFCATLMFACSQGVASLEIGVVSMGRPISAIGPLVADKISLTLPPLDPGAEGVRITNAKQVELAAHILHRALLVRLELGLPDNSRTSVSFFSFDADKALNPVLVACRLRPLPVADTAGDSSPPDE